MKNQKHKRILISAILTILFYIPVFFFSINKAPVKQPLQITLNLTKQDIKNKKQENEKNTEGKKNETIQNKKEIKNIKQNNVETIKDSQFTSKYENMNSKQQEADSALHTFANQNLNERKNPIDIIEKKIAENLKYPEIAKKRNISGYVVFQITTDSKLKLTGCRLIQSSGYKILDNDAAKLIESIFPIQTNDLDNYIEINENIRIDYELK